MLYRRVIIACATAIGVAAAATSASAQAQNLPGWARVSFFTQGASTTPTTGGDATTYAIVTSSIAAESARHAAGGFVEYGLKVQFGTCPSGSGRKQRVSVYDAYVAGGFVGGHLFAKAGQ